MQPTPPTQPYAVAARQFPQVGAPMPVDAETAAFLQSVRRRQRIWIVVGSVVAIALVVALLVWPQEIKQGVVEGASALWRLLQMIFGRLTN